MLSASEIADLEKKVNTYRLKSQLRYVFFIVLFVIVASILFFFYSNKITIFNINLFSETSKKNTTETVSIALNKEENASFSSPPISSQTKEEIPIAPVIVTQPAVAQTLLLKSPKVNTGKESKNNSSPLETPSIEPVKQNFSQKEPIRPPAEVLLSPSSREDLFYRSSEESIDTTVLAPPYLDEIKPKGVIKIESKEVNSIEYLKNKFEKTNNIIFALMLAEEYYVNKNYAESNKWALIANHIDAENEKSWLWFAKSKVKLGQKEDAIVALKAFLKTNKSQAAQTLLNKINLGELNE
jgi:hypothetical protein